jgi:hypothetical protein
MIPMYDAFVCYVQRLWKLSLKYCGSQPVFDCVLHRAAYIFVMDLHQATAAPWYDPESFTAFVKKTQGSNISYGGKMNMYCRDIFEYHKLGWDASLLRNQKTAQAEMEYAKHHGMEPRFAELFPSHLNDKAQIKPKPHKDTVQNTMQESPDSSHPVLAKVRECFGEQRYNLWFGSDTECNVEDGKAVFYLRNNFTITSIRKHCTAELEESLRILGLPVRTESGVALYRLEIKPSATPVKTREEEIKEMRELRDACNAEDRARKIPSATEMIMIHPDSKDFHYTEKPMPSGLTPEEEKALRKAMKQYVQECYEEFMKARNAGKEARYA